MAPPALSLPIAGPHPTHPPANDTHPTTASSNSPTVFIPGRQRSASASLMTGRSGSIRSARLPMEAHPTTPTIASFTIPPIPPTIPLSSTHAGGIQPSASFFYPSRPIHSYLPSRPRPASVASDASGSFGRASLAEDLHRQMSIATRTKVSREPLLPIGGPGLHKRSISRPRGAQANTGGTGGGNSGQGGRVRNSLEKIFRRTLSIDSYTKPKVVNDHTAFAEGRSPVEGLLELKTDFTPTRPQVPPSATRHRVRHPTFAPLPPRGSVDISAVPMTDPHTGLKIRKWKLHPSQNIFFLRGHFLTGGDSLFPFIGCLTVVLGLAGVWIGTTCVWWWKNESPTVAAVGAYLCLLTVTNMLATALRDPGILPRGLDPDPPYPNTTPDEGVRGPLPRDLKVRTGVVRVKYCATCEMYRPPRSSHCRMCDNCVDGCDHHCQWVNNCVGRRNYTSFIVFLTAAVISLCLIITTSALQIYLQIRKEHMNIKESLRKGAGSAFAFSLSMIVIWPVAGLLGYHTRLLFLNLTTVEQIRNSAHRSLGQGPTPPNPFALGNWRHNVAGMLCRPQGLSWLDASATATEDKREPNPGPKDLEAGGINNPQWATSPSS